MPTDAPTPTTATFHKELPVPLRCPESMEIRTKGEEEASGEALIRLQGTGKRGFRTVGVLLELDECVR